MRMFHYFEDIKALVHIKVEPDDEQVNSDGIAAEFICNEDSSAAESSTQDQNIASGWFFT